MQLWNGMRVSKYWPNFRSHLIIPECHCIRKNIKSEATAICTQMMILWALLTMNLHEPDLIDFYAPGSQLYSMDVYQVFCVLIVTPQLMLDTKRCVTILPMDFKRCICCFLLLSLATPLYEMFRLRNVHSRFFLKTNVT